MAEQVANVLLKRSRQWGIVRVSMPIPGTVSMVWRPRLDAQTINRGSSRPDVRRWLHFAATWELRDGWSTQIRTSQSLPDVSYAAVADARGRSGMGIERDDDIGPARDRALAADGSAVLDIRCDAKMPPIHHTPPTGGSKD